MASGFIDGAPTSSKIPVEYLNCVEIRAYHVEFALAVETATFSGRVRISVHIAGAPRRVLYLHAAGLELASAMINGAPASVVKGDASLVRLEMPVDGAVAGDQVIEVQFWGTISTLRPEGISMLGDDLKNPPIFPKTYASTSAVRDERGNKEGGGDANADAVHGSSSTALSSDRPVEQPAGFPLRGVLGTHLEPTHARDLFPCVDLPSCKAVFHLTLHGVPAHMQAISNSPILRVEEGERVGWADAGATAESCGGAVKKGPQVKSVSFLPTPLMPTYIFGFWVGDFHCLTTRGLAASNFRDAALLCCKALALNVGDSSAIGTEESRDDGGEGKEKEEATEVEINVHVLRAVSLEGARFALDFSRRAFELFSGLFAVRFPLPKLDLLGLPRMHGLGMENFGAITMLQDYMLVTGQTSFVRRRRIARLICHEVCHQWYGDIVTPQSFDELWLKEGLARFFEYVAVDALDSSFRVWTNFMTEVFFQAMLADSQKNSHPVVQQHDGDISSILQSFDTITYCKGASVLRMLCHCVGPSRFLEGTRRFVVDHQYACATQEDLWSAVQTVCDRDGVALNVRDLMRPWLGKAMFPVLRVRFSGANVLSITQHPFAFHDLQQTRAGHGVVSSAAGAAAALSPADRSTAYRKSDTRSVSEPRATSLPFGNIRSRGGPAAESDSESTSGVSDDNPGDVNTRSTAVVVEAGTRTAPSPRQQSSDLDESEDGGDRVWVIPLRIRVASGSRSPPNAAAGAGEGVEIGMQRGRIARGPGARAGEEMYSFFMSEASTSVILDERLRSPTKSWPVGEGPSSSRTRAEATRKEVGIGGSDDVEREGREGDRPYLVINDGHSGFFTVQYDCEKSWDLALAAIEQGALSECEATGFVHDLILGLHQRVLLERDVLKVGGSGQGTHGARGDVARLLSRLQDVVRLLGRDRGHPAWCAGQLFIWEMRMMYATNTIGDLRRICRRRRDPMPSRCRPSSRHDIPTSRPTLLDAADPNRSNKLHAGQPSEREATSAPSRSSDSDVTGDRQGAAPEVVDAASAAAAAAADSAEEKSVNAHVTAVAAKIFRRVATDLELAHKEAEEHVRWHSERVTSGMEQAAEPLQALEVMRDRLLRCRAQLSPSGTSLRVRDDIKGVFGPGAGDGNGKKVKVEAACSVTSPPR